MKSHFKTSFAIASLFLATASFAVDAEQQKTEIHFGAPSAAQDAAYL
jgi:hypothetical protein